MNYRYVLFFIRLSLSLFIITETSCLDFSAGLLYNNGYWESFISYGIPLETKTGTFKPKINMVYVNTPGLLGDSGHIKVELNVDLPKNSNLPVIVGKDLLFHVINESMDHNPARNQFYKNYNDKLTKQLASKKVKLEDPLSLQKKEYYLRLKEYMEQNHVRNFHEKRTYHSEKALWDEIREKHDN